MKKNLSSPPAGDSACVSLCHLGCNTGKPCFMSDGERPAGTPGWLLTVNWGMSHDSSGHTVRQMCNPLDLKQEEQGSSWTTQTQLGAAASAPIRSAHQLHPAGSFLAVIPHEKAEKWVVFKKPKQKLWASYSKLQPVLGPSLRSRIFSLWASFWLNDPKALRERSG